jgi:hypothetical protein
MEEIGISGRATKNSSGRTRTGDPWLMNSSLLDAYDLAYGGVRYANTRQ